MPKPIATDSVRRDSVFTITRAGASVVSLSIALAMTGCFAPDRLVGEAQELGESSGSTGDEGESPFDTGTPTGPDACGNGAIDEGEQCDLADLGDHVCASLGFGGGTLGCREDCTFDVASCGGCGNGVVEGDELCDGEMLGTQDSCDDVGLGLATEPLHCTPWCTLDFAECSACGDGTVMAPEVCEPGMLGDETCESQGYDGGTLGCTAGCAFDLGSCERCGNGILEGDEVCDGNQAVDDCHALGFDRGIIQCNDDCTYDTSACEACGDGELGAAEACDGDELGAASCASQGFTGGALACASDCTFDVDACTGTGCGDNAINGDEACDGGDLGGASCASVTGLSGGALSCSNACTIDSSSCWGCGDGFVDPGESCDGGVGAQTCASVTGLPNGTLSCTGGCALDTSDCSGPASLQVFITSSASAASFGGALGADAVCQSFADDAGLSGSFRAWVSDASTTPLARFTHSDGPYQLVGGPIIANDWDDLVDGHINAAIGTDEYGVAVVPGATTVATATTEGGVAQAYNGNCSGWTDATSASTAGIGNEENAFTWSASGAVFCDTPMSLYCFEQ